MTKLFTSLTATVVAVGILSASAFAQTSTMKPMHAMKPMKSAKMAAMCPFCKMPLGMKKSAKMPVKIMMNGKTYYTCAPCKAKVAAMSMKPMKAMAPKKTM